MSPWIATSCTLPTEGDPVEFVVERRCVALSGVYSACMFKSRWSHYSPAAVCEWRRLEPGGGDTMYRAPRQPEDAREAVAAP